MLKHAPSEQPGKATLCGLFEGYATIAFLAVDCPGCAKLMAAPVVAPKAPDDVIPFGPLEFPEFEVTWLYNEMLSLDGLQARRWYRAEIHHLIHFGPDVAGGKWDSERGAIYDVIESSDLRWLTKITIRKYPDAKFALRVKEQDSVI